MKPRNFNYIFEKLLKEKDPTLDSLQKKQLILEILFFIILILSIILYFFQITTNDIVVIIVGIIFLIDVILLFINGFNYKKNYKKSVITSLVKAYSPDLNYFNKPGVSKREYDSANYREYYDRYHSEDLIYGKIDDLFVKMSEVVTTRIEHTTDSEGRTQTQEETVFRGIFGIIDLKNGVFPNFELTTNRFLSKYSKARIEVDSAIFEKNYDLYSEDKIKTMQIFTSDLIDELNKFKDELKKPIEIKIRNGFIFFRFYTTNSFEAPVFSKALDFEKTYNVFKLIDCPMKIISKILDNDDLLA